MDDKGKGKAVDPISVESDSDDDFFVSKRRPIVRQATPPPKSPSPPIRAHSDEETSSPDSQFKKRRKPQSKKHGLELPGWTRINSNEHKKNGASGRSRKGSSQIRGSTEERGETIVIDDSDDEAGPSTSKGKGTRRRVQLTPPPEMSDAKKAEIEQLVKAHLGSKFQDRPVEEVNDSFSSPEKENEQEIEKVYITIRMVAPPERKLSAAPAALKEYQKARTLILARTGPMSRGINTLSDRLQKRSEDIVFVYNDSKVYPRSTPEQLGIVDKAEMSGYEKEYWDRLQAERRKALEGSSDNEEPDPLNGNEDNYIENLNSPTTKTNGELDKINSLNTTLNNDQIPTETQEEDEGGEGGGSQDYIRFIIKSESGELRMKGQKTLKINTILKYYCKANNKPIEESERMYISFDGDKLDKENCIGDTEIEDGDMLEVGYIQIMKSRRR
ncbi:uncharacterized protein I206_104253 [Kwoniella pini CBS 10737]|uniref:Rad60/SUMO-like domain-containing protein n=1 Tax=Kwoniella pini CBS 10737 TaxID=1296096 RepID=A0A1B9I291_9TREE|nr:uncharacterized protein I206_04171 [Kwoniella pini CBS 10737]OCF49649.1 hypothetical protein I206_04171 [Kwoniella pini CBS 10737]